MRIGLILISNDIGGSEKQYANFFSYVSSISSHDYTLIIPNGLFNDLCDQGILSECYQNVERIFRRFPYHIYNDLAKIRIRGHRLPGITLSLIPILRCQLLSRETADLISKFDIVHFCVTNPVLFMPKDKIVLLDEANSQSAHKLSSQVLSWLKNGAYINCISETIAQSYKRAVSDPKVSERVFTAPCSFTDYSKVFIARKERLVAFVARMEKVKHPEIFAAAISILAKYRNDFRAVMLGRGRLDRKIDSLIAKNKLGHVLQRFYTPRPLEILSRAAIFVSIQEFDNYSSQSLMEAMASGCAVVASDRGETGKLVTDDTGFRVPLSAEAVAERLDYMLNHFDDTIAMGLQARKKVMQEHTIERYVSYLEGVYERIVSRPM